jgi:predicted regulator of Ras-like GTPase activity (Roadblock/LC7/MglB family)
MQARQRENGKRIVLSEESFKKVADLLQDFLKRSRATLCVFADMNGYPIAYQGYLNQSQVASLTALAAGDFLATSEMAKLTQNGDRFSFIFHEGVKQNLYLCSLGDDYLLVVLFHKSIALGLIRVLTQHIIEQLQQLLEQFRQQYQENVELFDNEFRALLGKELDKAFGSKRS